MFVKRKRNILARKYQADESNIAFLCKKKFSGFTVNKLYKPFAYSLNAEYYKNFCVFDDFGRAMFIESNLIEKGFFGVVYTNMHDYEHKVADIMNDVDKENEKIAESIGFLKGSKYK